MQVAWGDVPTWLAFIAAFAAGGVAFRVYRIEANRDRKAEEDGRRGQAGKVAAWYGAKEAGVAMSGGPVQPQPVTNYVWGAYVRNASDLPVYQLTVRFHFPSPPQAIRPQPQALTPSIS